jgi:hypothetical protein
VTRFSKCSEYGRLSSCGESDNGRSFPFADAAKDVRHFIEPVGMRKDGNGFANDLRGCIVKIRSALLFQLVISPSFRKATLARSGLW